MFLFVLCLLISIHLVHSSRGDRSVPYQGCISSCLQQHLCNPDFGDISWAFLSCARCRYKCVWDTVTYFQRHNEEVPQFHGKWPFVALDVPSIGVFIQEPASTLFSIGNLLGMITMYRRIQQANLRYGSTMWSLYSLVGITTWICSTAFHCIDIRLTEYLDYFSAFGFVIFAMYASTHVVFSELSSSTNGKTFSKFLAVICFGFYSNHIFQMIMDAYDINEKTNDLPYGAEYAKSGRSSCKKCHNCIGEGALRMSAREPSRFYDGIQDNWFHFDCFFNKLGRGDHINERSIRGMDTLRWEDQEKIRGKIDEVTRTGPIPSTSFRKYSNYKAEYSKSNRGKCVECKKNIEAKYIKIGYKSGWYHQKCIFKEASYEGSISDICGFTDLTQEDQLALIQEYTAVTPNDTTAPSTNEIPNGQLVNTPAPTSDENHPKNKNESDNDEDMPIIKKFCFQRPIVNPAEILREKLKKQSEIMWDMREKLQRNRLSKKDLVALLEYNSQMNDIMRKKTEDNLLEHFIDCATFGKPTKCDKCPNGLLVYSLSLRSYACIGYMSEFTRCVNVNPNPPRTPFSVPLKIMQSNPFLKTVRFNALSLRVYPAEEQKVVQRRDSNYFKHLGSRGATEQFIEGVKSGIDETGHSRKLIKFGTAVDSEFEHAAVCHVYRDTDGTLFSTTLHQTDVAMNINSYYKIQLLKHDTKAIFYLFRSWGRVGTNVGGIKSDYFGSVTNAIRNFEELFREKTGNDWVNRKYFLKKPGFFMLVETDYSELENVDINDKAILPGSVTKLHRAIKEIILMISDMSNINRTLNELQLDTTRMPLGKLSKQQITNAYSVLTEAQSLIRGNGSQADILDATNRFYTLVPHDFGMKNADILDNMDIIKKKCEMLDSLMDFQFAYDFLKQGESAAASNATRDPVDIHYEKLKCNMEYVDPRSDTFKLVSDYLKISHGQTHNTFSLEIIDVIEVKRDGEDEKFLKEIGNRKLLWHGSRVGNFVGILSQGLRIAPPEAPATGYMFGKGVYFADMVSKSANYCGIHQNGDGLILLCDVALGKMQEERHAKNVRKPDKGYSSLKGVGRIHPVDGGYDHPDGYTVHMNGIAIADNKDPSSLIYNEYIVYNVDQIRLKYLLRCRFSYRY